MIEEGISQLIDPHLFRMALFRWLDIVGIVLWVGAIGFRRLIFFPSIQRIHDPETRARLEREEASYTDPVLSFTLLYLFILHLVTLIHQGEMMSGKPLSDILPVLPVVLSRTHFGLIWIIKFSLLICLFVLTRSRMKANSPLLLGLGLFLCLTGSLTGHAVTRSQYWGIIFSDWFHFAAVAVWAGGLLPLRRIARRSAGLMTPSQLASFLEKIISVFSKWAVTCVMVIILTGMINASVYLDWQSPLGFPYGKVLLSKLILVGAVLSLGGVSKFYILPSFRKIRDGAAMKVSDLERQFFYAITIEIGFVIATLILAALLTQTPPPHLGR